MSKRIAFRNAHLIDPANKLDVKGQLIVENGRIADVLNIARRSSPLRSRQRRAA